MSVMVYSVIKPNRISLVGIHLLYVSAIVNTTEFCYLRYWLPLGLVEINYTNHITQKSKRSFVGKCRHRMRGWKGGRFPNLLNVWHIRLPIFIKIRISSDVLDWQFVSLLVLFFFFFSSFTFCFFLFPTYFN